MHTLVIDRSTEVQSLAWMTDDVIVATHVLKGLDGRSGAWAAEVRAFIAAYGKGDAPARILVGTGPGSFAGIRAALSFAQGYAIGSKCEVMGLPSPCGCAPTDGPRAVVGDARGGLFWVALFDGLHLVRDVFQTGKDELSACVPLSAPVVSPDDARIGAALTEIFEARYKGVFKPDAAILARYACADPGKMKAEPLPIYLNPAVRS